MSFSKLEELEKKPIADFFGEYSCCLTNQLSICHLVSDESKNASELEIDGDDFKFIRIPEELIRKQMRIECETLIGGEYVSFKTQIAGDCKIAEVSVPDFKVDSDSFVKHFTDVRSQLNPDDSCFTGLTGLYEQCYSG